MTTQKIIYYISTGLLTLIMLFSAYNYFFNQEMIQTLFTNYGYPTYLIYPLAIAKLLGLVAIWSRLSSLLKEWAYAGFFFDMVLAFAAHYMTDGGYAFAAVGLLALIISRYFDGKIFA